MIEAIEPSLIVAMREVVDFFEDFGRPYAIIGGVALGVWATERPTNDVDIDVLIDPEEMDEFVSKFFSAFRPKDDRAVEMTPIKRIACAFASNGVPIDVGLALPGLHEEQCILRSVRVDMPGGGSIPVIGRDDLIILKCLAGRPQDVIDLKRLLAAANGSYDGELILSVLRPMEELVYPVDPVALFKSVVEQDRLNRGEAKAEYRSPSDRDDPDKQG